MHSTKHFTMMLYAALALHAALVFGIYFTPENHTLPPTTLEVTLATQPSLSAPRKADYLSDKNQKGSGMAKDKHIPKAEQHAQQKATLKKTAQRNTASLSHTGHNKKPPITTTSAQAYASVHRSKKSRKSKSHLKIEPTNLQSQIDRLQKQVLQQREIEAKRPRIYYAPSVASNRDLSARYKHQWRTKIERIGNAHYPKEARRKGLHGQLQLLVAIRADGSLREVKVMHSSGIAILDNAAIGIVQLAAPYPAFQGALQDKYDVLEMIRTWHFEKGLIYH